MYVDILRASGATESVATDSEGRYFAKVGYKEPITVTLRGYTGTGDNVTSHHFSVAVDAGIDDAEIDDVDDETGTGTRPSVKFSASKPAEIHFFDVQTSRLQISLLGGSVGARFINGQDFEVSATCGYVSETFATQQGHVACDLPAMPTLTITMLRTDSDVPAIGFAEDTDEYGNWQLTDLGRVQCASSTVRYIYDYFEEMGQLEQEVDLSVNESAAVTYTYVSPLCLRMIVDPDKSTVAKLAQSQRGLRTLGGGDLSWVESFLLEDPVVGTFDDLYGTQCFNSTEQILTEGDEVSISFVGFEKYPNPLNCVWPKSDDDDGVGQCNGIAASDYITSSSYFAFSLEILDAVAGRGQQSFDDIAASLSYTLIAGAPRAFSPFTKELLVQASRSATSAAHGPLTMYRYIPVLGELPEEVPRVYPVSTDPTLIFSVLRDPPGGSSSTTLAEGSAFGFSMSIDGMRAASRSDGSVLSSNGGIRGGGPDLEEDRRRRRLTSDVLKLPNITAQLVEQYINASGSRRRLGSMEDAFEFIAGTCVTLSSLRRRDLVVDSFLRVRTGRVSRSQGFPSRTRGAIRVKRWRRFLSSRTQTTRSRSSSVSHTPFLRQAIQTLPASRPTSSSVGALTWL